MIRSGWIAVILVCFASQGHAQHDATGLPEVENLQDFYRTGVGFRIGWPVAALTVKHFIEKQTALEFIVAPQFDGASFTTLVEFHRPLKRPGMYWYYGFGADIGRFASDKYEDYDGDHYATTGYVTAVAIDAVIGAEANIHETPFSIGFDIKPHIGVYNAGGSVIEAAVTLKYVWSNG